MFDGLWEQLRAHQLTACGESVGLPEGQMGNSEVGHLNLGAGAIVPQDLARIDEAVEDGSLAENEVLLDALRDAPRVHLIGLVSDGGVHSSDRHLKALIELAAKEGVEDLVIHAFTDGRDTSPHGGAELPGDVEAWMRRGRRRRGSARSIGRYFAMDRDTRWDRTEKAVRPAHAGRRPSTSADVRRGGRQAAYERDETDEFITADEGRRRGARSAPATRLRVQLPPRPHAPDHRGARRDDRGASTTLRDADRVRGGLAVSGRLPARAARVTLAQADRRPRREQLHVAETEKYPHVTYFFNGGEEEPYAGEVRELVRLAARRADVRPEARDERARGRRRVRRALGGATRRRSGSSTSPTPTWSATPA